MPKLTEQLAAPLRQMQVRQEKKSCAIFKCWNMVRFLLILLWSGVCEAHRQGFSRRQAGGGRGDVSEPVQTPPDGRGFRLGQRRHIRTNLQDDRCL